MSYYRKKNYYLKQIPFVALGFAIGWSFDFFCKCKGSSMEPTLKSNDLLLFIPYAWLCVRKIFNAPLVYNGDIVVMKIDKDLCICKRVVKSTSQREVAEKWNDEEFQEIEPYYYSEQESTKQIEYEMPNKSDPILVEEKDGTCKINNTIDVDINQQKSISNEKEVKFQEETDEYTIAQNYYEHISYKRKIPRARNWDSCIDRIDHPSQWLWLEGDNKEESFDSRYCGSVPAECLRGKVVGVLWPKPRLIHTLKQNTNKKN